MNRFSFRMLVLAVLILLPWLGLRALMPVLQNPAADLHFTTCAFAIWLGSPFLALVALELISRRALGLGFTVIRRDESRRVYWFYVGVHASLALIVMAAALVYCLHR